MEFFRRAEGMPHRLGILPGSFNPPTRAHLQLAAAALGTVDQVLFVLPSSLPHKPYTGATFEQRVEMLCAACSGRPRVSVATTTGGLFYEIAAECRQYFDILTRLTFLCGNDAAERIIEWDYGSPDALKDMLESFDLLVAARTGEFRPPEIWQGRIVQLEFSSEMKEVSSTAVRERIATGQPWEHLVPPEIIGLVRAIFGKRS